ncbi:Tim44 domain-containing protein [Methylosinus sp. Sm6]|uniref:Tim44 domain-containing protein n=1 Tax=Methylosinus sp. Sm6 TaxID=2866948 RepID=UPI001C99AB7C|nr:Tim44 domain-containing protein [Methylosinus sp. Sm6]MBY6241462.1 39S ribosomal protein L45 [Methylosinus sp. Sm6]
MSLRSSHSKSLSALALAALLALAPAVGEAKMGGGMSSGSRGSRSFSPPPATNTAPRPAAPLQRSMEAPPAATQGPSRPAFNPAPASGMGSFGRGLLGGLAGGLLGAGLFGMLSGHGLFGGLGGFASMLGLLLQLALIFFLARLAFQWFAGRRLAGALGGAGGAGPQPAGFGFMGVAGGGSAAPPRSAPISLSQADFPAFERLLAETQEAYSREDVARLDELATPEMASYFAEDLKSNAREGVVNRISGVKLLQGDLAEAWREGGDDYATVAMRFALVDQFVDRATGKAVRGDATPTQSTEVWTFRRPAGRGPESWKLSAIQQAA